MRLQFGPDDEDDFFRAKQEIVDDFTLWVAHKYDDHDQSLVADAETFLSWRFDYSTGDLSSFDVGDVDEFLLRWAPRKLSMRPEGAPVLCRAVELMIEFLATTGRLEGGNSRAARIIAHVDGIVHEVAESLGGESKFGLAKGLLGLNLTDSAGHPLTDLISLLDSDDSPSGEHLQAILDERMQAFNSLAREERLAITDPLLESRGPQPVELPFMLVPPTVNEVEQSARGSRLLTQVDGLVRHLGTSGLKLTNTGNLRLADARELIEVLDTGDAMDPDTYGMVQRTRTSLDLRWLTLIEDVAVTSGAAVRLKTKLNPNPQWLGQPLVERASMIVKAVLYMGPLGSKPRQVSADYERTRQLLDDGVPHWMSDLLPSDSVIQFDELAREVHQVAERQFADAPELLASGGFWAFIDEEISELFDVLQRAGIVDWVGHRDVPNRFGGDTHFVEGSLTLTALGRHTMPEQVEAAGYVLNSVADLADASPLTLLNAVATSSVSEEEALARWRSGDSTDVRARLIAEGALAAEHPIHRIVAFSLLGELQPVAEVAPVVRELLDSPCSGQAATFLLDTGLATSDEVGMFITLGPIIDILYCEIDHPENLDQLFRTVQEGSEADLIEEIWRHDQPETLELLEALGRHLTDKKMAKTARKAVFRHRSWMANEGR